MPHIHALTALASPVFDPERQAFPPGWRPVNDISALLSVNIGME